MVLTIDTMSQKTLDYCIGRQTLVAMLSKMKNNKFIGG